MNNFTSRPGMQLGTYRHYKGGEYEVIALACDEETHDWRVIYKPLYETEPDAPDLWERKYTVFTELVAINGIKTMRFEKIDD